MSITAERKNEVISQFRKHESDTGSSEVQIAILSKRIENLTDHFKTHQKDHSSRRGLIKLVNQRRHLLDYLKNKNFDSYTKLIADLGLRK